MARLKWKKDTVFSVKLRSNVFALAQMLHAPYAMFFLLFREDDEWDDIDLQTISDYFIVAIARQFIALSPVRKHHMPVKTNSALPRCWIRSSPESQMVKVWENTANETTLMMLGGNGCSLIERDIAKKGMQQAKVVTSNIAFTDNAATDHYEMTNIRMYPELNERLRLCHLFGRNVDPLKELHLRKSIPLAYTRYVDIISGKVKVSALGY